MVQIRTLVGSKEYSEFKNVVILVENSFAEVKKNGTGIQQVRLAITPEFLITASYVILDPHSTTLELVNVIPLDYLRISAYSDRRHIIRIYYCTGIVRYFELSERNNSCSVWRNWCDRIRFINGEMLASSVSDLSINTKRSTAGGNETSDKKYMDKSSFADLVNEDPLKDVMNMLDLSEEENKDIGVVVNQSLLELMKTLSNAGVKSKKNEKGDESRDVHCVPRFASGVSERCENHLILGAFGTKPKERIICKRNSETVLCPNDTVMISVVKECTSDSSIYFSSRDFVQMVEENDLQKKKEK